MGFVICLASRKASTPQRMSTSTITHRNGVSSISMASSSASFVAKC